MFVCYSHTDRDRVYTLIGWLQERNVNVWYDDGISGGSIWRAQIGEAIERASSFLYFLSSASVGSEHCSREINLALDTGTPVVPVYLEDTDLTSDLKVGLSRIHALKADAPRFREQLLQSVTGHGGEIGTGAPSLASARGARRPRIAIAAASSLVVLVAAAFLFPALFAPGSGERSAPVGLLDRPMVAVLPIATPGRDPAYEHLSIGLMDEIIVSLQRFRSFPVVSRGAALALENRNAPVTDMARTLRASYVVDASVRREGSNAHLLATLSRADGTQVWARRFVLGEGLSSLFSAVDEVAAAIAGAVRDSEVDRVEAADRPPVAAWEHYMKALSVILEWHPERYAEAVANARRATELDPDMAEAWWALGELTATNLMVSPEPLLDETDALETSLRYFQRAHEISPFHGAACGCLGMTLLALGRPDEAFVVLEEALNANPLSSALRVDYGQSLVSVGRLDEAYAMAASAAQMEPIGKDLGMTYLTRAIVDLARNDVEAGRANIHRALFAHADNEMVMPVAVPLLYILGDVDGAARTYRDLMAAFPEFRSDNPYSMLLYRPLDDVITKRRAAGEDLPPTTLDILEQIRSAVAT